MKYRSHSGTLKTARSERELAHGVLARRMAAEGMVLLKNEDILPFAAPLSIALFGGGAVWTVKGGIGSGEVNNRENVSIYRGLKEADVQITSESWIADYKNRYQDARMAWKDKVLEDAKHVENPFDAYAANPFSLPEGRTIHPDDLKGASAAVYVISRIAGEGKDRRRIEGDYELSKKEREDLQYLNQTGIPIVLLLNVGAPIALSDILQEAENIKAILHICLPGQEGGYAVADVLLGHALPGGKLTATWAKQYEDYPCANTFGYLNGDLEIEEYREGIYVGYRYFDSFGIEPLFPFGYGLSYTAFSIEFEGIQRTANGIEITISVKNTKDIYAGREVVQVYTTPPQTKMPKEYQRLVGFAKTKVLEPHEVQRLTIPIEQSCLTSYSEEMHAWIMEQGRYGIWIGNQSASLQLVALLEVPEQTIVEKLQKICPISRTWEEFSADQSLKERSEKWLQIAEKQKLPCISFVPNKEEIRSIPMPVAKEQSVTELLPLFYGNITEGTSTLGSSGIRVPGSAGETTEALEKNYGIRSLIMADGPAGLRLRQNYEVDRETDSVYGVGVLGSLENGFLEETKPYAGTDTYYQYCTAFPVGTALAQSWDLDLLREFGEAIATEMREFHVDLWLAPGMNIQRNPLCGRNFEYYSEDPFLSGMMAAATTEGVQSHRGCGVTIKHFACNNQEDNRMSVDAHISERTLREIYLRGFEIAVKKSRPAALMSSYNQINGVHAANNRDLCTIVAREEWGFEGVIMSDWNTTVPEDGSIPWKCIEAGNDIIMPGNPKDAQDIQETYEQGTLSEETIRHSAGRILQMIQKLTK